MTEPSIEDCLAWITRSRGVSFVELEHWLAERGMTVQGDLQLEPLDNVILWAGVSQEFCDFLDALRATGRLDMRSMGAMEAFLVYSADGKLLRLPFAKRIPKKGYKEPHWAPVYLVPEAAS
jgi:hypothetical protein